MDMFLIMVISVINVLAISVSLTFFLIKGYEHIILERIIHVANKNNENLDSEPLIREQMNSILKKFNISFIILEIALIFYFIFWAILLYRTTI